MQKNDLCVIIRFVCSINDNNNNIKKKSRKKSKDFFFYKVPGFGYSLAS